MDKYHNIVGIFHDGKYSIFNQQIDFYAFYQFFIFVSLAPFYNTGGHTHFVKYFLDSFLNEKKTKIKPHKNCPLYAGNPT